MANTDWAFGFQPWLNVLRAQYYCVTHTPDIAVMHGDMVGTGGSYLETPAMGYLGCIKDDVKPDGLDNILGAVLAVFDENMNPLSYMAIERVGNDTIAGYILVADHPDQLFVAREDFAGGAILKTEAFQNTDIVSATDCEGNYGTGVSTQLIDSDVAESSDLNLKLMGPHPDDVDLVAENTPGSSGDQGCRYICMISEHYYGLAVNDGGIAA